MHYLADQINSDAWNVLPAIVPDVEKLAGKRVLVTGGTGILGIYFMAVFGVIDSIYGLESLTYTSVHNYGDFNNLIKSLAKNAVWIQTDMTVGSQVRTLPRADIIIHAAGYGQPAKFMANPLATISLNTSALILLNHLLNDNGRMLFVSSSEVYSGNAFIPHTETAIGTSTPQHPRGAYIEGKRCGEAITHAINTTSSKTAKSARVSLSYGPGTRKDDDRVLNQFIKKALTEGVIACKDSGVAGRTYCYVSDSIEMMMNILLRGKHEVYNVAGMSDVSIKSLANIIAELTGTKATFPEATSLGDTSAPMWVRSDISLYRKEFGKDKFVDMVDGLTRTINWQKLLYGKV
jgi:nucleoside-diphosphate-sugar epimerase